MVTVVVKIEPHVTVPRIYGVGPCTYVAFVYCMHVATMNSFTSPNSIMILIVTRSMYMGKCIIWDYVGQATRGVGPAILVRDLESNMCDGICWIQT